MSPAGLPVARRATLSPSGAPPPAQQFAPGFQSANVFVFTVGTPADATVQTTGKPTATLTASALAPGLTFTDNGDGTGSIAGTPTQAGNVATSVTATNVVSSVTQPIALAVLPATTPPTFTTAPAWACTQGIPQQFVIGNTGSPYPTVSVISGSLPPGITLVQRFAWVLTGTPSASGTYSFTLQANNGFGTVTQPFIVIVNSNTTPPTMTSPSTFNFTEGTALSNVALSAAGNPAPTYAFTIGTLPPGVSLNGTTGALTGTPTTPGSYSVAITATNSGGTANQAVQFNVASTLAFTTAASTTFGNGVHGAFLVSAAGNGTISFTEGGSALPAGLTYTPYGNGNLLIIGTTTAGGTYNLVLTAHNGIDADVIQDFTLTVPSGAVQPDPSGYIANITPSAHGWNSAGTVWDGGGQTYLTPGGIWITNPNVTIQNATFTNPYLGQVTAVAVPAPNQLQLADLVSILPIPFSIPSSSGLVEAIQYIGGPGIHSGAGEVVITAVDTATNTITLTPTGGASITGLVAGPVKFNVITHTKFAAQPGSPHGRAGELGPKPLVRVQDANGVTLSNINSIGGNRGQTGYQAPVVAQAGFQIDSSGTPTSPVTMLNCSALDTCGDSITFGNDQVLGTPSFVNLNGFTGDTAGRQGITPGVLQGVTGTHCVLQNITIINPTEQAMNWQSDTSGGCGWVDVDNFTCLDAGIDFTSPLAGPINFTNLVLGQAGQGRYFTVHASAGVSQKLVTVNGGTIYIVRAPTFPPAGIWLDGGAQVTFNNVAFHTQAGAGSPGPAWVVQEATVEGELQVAFGVAGAHLTLHTCTLDGVACVQGDGQNDNGTPLPGSIAWSSSVTYHGNDYVGYAGVTYKCSPTPFSKPVTSIPSTSDSGKNADWNYYGPTPYPLGSLDTSVVTIS
jgi:hypothetical protein